MVSQVGSDHLRLLWPILWRDSSQRQRVEMVRPPRWNFALSDVCMNRISVKWIDICIVCPSFYSWVLFHLRTLLAVYFLHVPQLILALLGCPTSWAEWNGYCSWRCGITGSGGSPHASSIRKKKMKKTHYWYDQIIGIKISVFQVCGTNKSSWANRGWLLFFFFPFVMSM